MNKEQKKIRVPQDGILLFFSVFPENSEKKNRESGLRETRAYFESCAAPRFLTLDSVIF